MGPTTARRPRAPPKNPPPRRRALAAVAATLAAVLMTAAASAAQPAPPTSAFVWHAQPRTGPVAAAAAIRKTTWLSGFRITEYYPAPEAWAVGRPVATPGLPGKHRIDWLYGGFGLSMEGTGIGLDGRLYHIDSLGRGGWVSRTGKATFDGIEPLRTARRTGARAGSGATAATASRSRSWPSAGGATASARARSRPRAGSRSLRARGTPGLRYWRTIAVDPSLIRFGSRVYVPYYRHVKGATGWFVANDTGGATTGATSTCTARRRPTPMTAGAASRASGS